MKEVVINTFNTGKVDDVRTPSKTGFYFSQHFDIFTNPKRLVPYPTQVVETSDSIGTYKITDFVTSSNGRLYVKGENQPTNNRTKIMYKADPISTSAGSYTFPTSATGNGINIGGVFFEYKNYLWGFQGTNQVFKYGDITGSPTITDTAATTTGTISTVAQGLIGKDDNGYLFYNNVIVKITAALTISEISTIVPTNYKITSVDYYGTYLAIAAAPVNTTGVGISKLFIWDYVSADPTQVIDFGEGNLVVIGNIEGRIVGISDVFISSTYGANRGTMVIRVWSGGQAQVFKEIQSFSTGILQNKKVIKNNKLYWIASIVDKEGETWKGIWVFGRKDITGDFAVTLDTVQGDVSTFFGFSATGNYWHIAYAQGDSTRAVSLTGTAYTQTSIWESVRFQSDGEAQVKAIAMNYNALPAAGQIILKYRKQGETSWTTMHTETTDNGTGFECGQLDTGASLPTFQEIQFRIESTGNAEPFEFKFKFKESNTLYSNIK